VPEPTRGVIDLGWPDDAARQRFLSFLNKQDVHEDEFALAVGRHMLPLFASPTRRVVTRRRRDLQSDAEWYSARAFRHYHEFCGIDDHILSISRIDEEMLHVIALHRPLGGEPFSRRDARLVHWLHAELRGLIGESLARGPRVRQDRPGLSPRLREVLEYLLAGDSEKEVAHRLGIAPAAVHEHVKRLHRLLDVSTRGELLSNAQRVLERTGHAELPKDAAADGP
jgi:DNA-binding CsgD family transcriptional regulator